MCGITGIFNAKNKISCNSLHVNQRLRPDIFRTGTEEEKAIHRAVQQMRDRGPDDEGVFSSGHAVLGHTRLAVIDVNGGKQPHIDPNTGATLVFNGEIYNYRNLRQILISKQHVFLTNSDTEVLLKAYLEWGINCLSRLHGMYAFGIYDPAKKQMFLARDRLGVKPLYYSWKNSCLFFASSCAAMHHFPQISKQIDIKTLSHYLTTIRTSMGPNTMYKDIQTLLPGEYLLVRDKSKQPSIRRYWSIPITPQRNKDNPGIKTASDKVRELCEKAVDNRLISDVPLGGFLSGGLDSSIITSIAQHKTGGKFNAFSAGYNRPGYNEWDYAQKAAEFYSMQCHKVKLCREEFDNTWRQLTRSKGLPVSTPNEIAIYHLAKTLKQQYTVALTGEGADEIFGGYTMPIFSANDYDRARRTPPSGNEALSDLDLAMRRLYLRPHFYCRTDHFLLMNSWIPANRKKQLFKNTVWEENLQKDAAMFDFYEDLLGAFSQCSTFDAYMHVHARINLEGLLSRVDSSTMSASVEARVPFTDHEIVEFLFSLPDHYKIAWKNNDARKQGENLNIKEITERELLKSKRLLRHAFSSEVPDEILHRKKVSFAVPFMEWMAEGPSALIKTSLESSRLLKELFNQQNLSDLLSTSEYTPSAMALWPILNLARWEEECGASL